MDKEKIKSEINHLNIRVKYLEDILTALFKYFKIRSRYINEIIIEEDNKKEKAEGS